MLLYLALIFVTKIFEDTKYKMQAPKDNAKYIIVVNIETGLITRDINPKITNWNN